MAEQNIDVVIRARDEATRTLDQVAGSIEKIGSRVAIIGGAIAGGVFAAVTFKKIRDAAAEATEAYIAQERSARGLSDAQRQLSASLQDALAIQDDTINAAMRQAKMLGMAEQHMDNATKTAIGLSAATGMNLTSAMFRVNEAINGNANALATYIPALRNATSEKEKLNLSQK